MILGLELQTFPAYALKPEEKAEGSKAGLEEIAAALLHTTDITPNPPLSQTPSPATPLAPPQTATAGLEEITPRTNIVPVVTPLISHPDGSLEVDKEGVKRYFKYLSATMGVTAILVVGATGEFHKMDRNLRQSAIQILTQEAKGKFQVFANITGNDAEETLENARIAKASGADAFVVAPLFFFSIRDEQKIAEWIDQLQTDVGLPIALYNNPALHKDKGYNISVDLVKMLWDNRKIIAIKDSSGNVDVLQKYLATTIPLYQGDEGKIETAMHLGARGIVGSSGSILNFLQQFPNPHDTDGWHRLQRDVLEVRPILTVDLQKIPAGLKYVLSQTKPDGIPLMRTTLMTGMPPLTNEEAHRIDALGLAKKPESPTAGLEEGLKGILLVTDKVNDQEVWSKVAQSQGLEIRLSSDLLQARKELENLRRPSPFTELPWAVVIDHDVAPHAKVLSFIDNQVNPMIQEKWTPVALSFSRLGPNDDLRALEESRQVSVFVGGSTGYSEGGAEGVLEELKHVWRLNVGLDGLAENEAMREISRYIRDSASKRLPVQLNFFFRKHLRSGAILIGSEANPPAVTEKLREVAEISPSRLVKIQTRLLDMVRMQVLDITPSRLSSPPAAGLEEQKVVSGAAIPSAAVGRGGGYTLQDFTFRSDSGNLLPPPLMTSDGQYAVASEGNLLLFVKPFKGMQIERAIPGHSPRYPLELRGTADTLQNRWVVAGERDGLLVVGQGLSKIAHIPGLKSPRPILQLKDGWVLVDDRGENRLAAVNLAAGEIKPMAVQATTPAVQVADGRILVGSSAHQKEGRTSLVFVDATTGAVETVEGLADPKFLVPYGNQVLVATHNTLRLFDPAAKTFGPEVRLSEITYPPTVTFGNEAVVPDFNTLVKVDVSTGQIKGRIMGLDHPRTPVELVNGRFLVPELRGLAFVSFLSGHVEALIPTETPNGLYPLTGRNILVASPSGFRMLVPAAGLEEKIPLNQLHILIADFDRPRRETTHRMVVSALRKAGLLDRIDVDRQIVSMDTSSGSLVDETAIMAQVRERIGSLRPQLVLTAYNLTVRDDGMGATVASLARRANPTVLTIVTSALPRPELNRRAAKIAQDQLEEKLFDLAKGPSSIAQIILQELVPRLTAGLEETTSGETIDQILDKPRGVDRLSALLSRPIAGPVQIIGPSILQSLAGLQQFILSRLAELSEGRVILDRGNLEAIAPTWFPQVITSYNVHYYGTSEERKIFSAAVEKIGQQNKNRRLDSGWIRKISPGNPSENFREFLKRLLRRFFLTSELTAPVTDPVEQLIQDLEALAVQPEVSTRSGLEEEWVSLSNAKIQIWRIMEEAHQQGILLLRGNVLIPSAPTTISKEPDPQFGSVTVRFQGLHGFDSSGPEAYSTDEAGRRVFIERLSGVERRVQFPTLRFNVDQKKFTIAPPALEARVTYKADAKPPEILILLRPISAAGLEEAGVAVVEQSVMTVEEAKEVLQRLVEKWGLANLLDLWVVAVSPEVVAADPKLQALVGKPVSIGRATLLVVPREQGEMVDALIKLANHQKTVQSYGRPDDELLGNFEQLAHRFGLTVNDRISLETLDFQAFLRQLISNLSGLPAEAIEEDDLITLERVLAVLA